MECDFDPIPIKPAETSISVTIKPMLFAGNQFYPYGGWDDFKGFFDDIEEAKEALEKNNYFDWAHIVIEGKIAEMGFQDGYRGNGWRWEKKE